MSNIPYLRILKDSFVLTWKNRYLWWFGFFLSLSGLGSYNYTREDKDKADIQAALLNHPQAMKIILVGAALFFVAFVIIIIASIISRGALIDSIEKHTRGEISDFKSAWKKGRGFFWKVLLIDVFSGLFAIVAAIILFPPVAFLFWNHNYIIGVLMAIIAAIIFIPLIILIAYIKIFGYLYSILGNLKAWAAIENAYLIFKKNILSSLIMSVLIILANIIVFFILLFAIIPLLIIFLPLALIFFLLLGKIGAITIGCFGFFILLAILVFLRSLLGVFSQSVWVLFFHEIAQQPEPETVTETASETEPVIDSIPSATINSEQE